MTSNKNHRVLANEEGNLVLPAEVARKYGIKPGTNLHLEEAENGFFLRRPVSHLAKIYIEPTSLCNLSCRTCIRNVWNEPMGQMKEDTFERIMGELQVLDPRPSIFFGGFGEPLSHHRITDMVARANKIGCKVELITNGMLLNEERARALIEAGLNTLWVSVDGATPASYADVRLGAALPDILKNIAGYRDLHRLNIGGDPDIGLVFVAMRRNIADLPELLKMSTRLGISRYLVTNVLPYTNDMCAEMLYSRAVDTLNSSPSPWSPHLDFPPMDANQSTREPLIRMMSAHPHNILMDQRIDRRDHCPFVRQGSVAIAWDGSLSPCLPLMHQHESYLMGLHRVVQRYVVGNVVNQGLIDLWESPEYVDFRKKVDGFDFSPCTICASCEMAESNQEDCFGNTFPTCGGCLWAQGFIRCP